MEGEQISLTFVCLQPCFGTFFKATEYVLHTPPTKNTKQPNNDNTVPDIYTQCETLGLDLDEHKADVLGGKQAHIVFPSTMECDYFLTDFDSTNSETGPFLTPDVISPHTG